MMGLWTAYKALNGLKAMAVNAGLILALLASLYGWHKWQTHAAFNAGRAAERKAAMIEAGKRIQDMEKNNEQFRNLSARERCVAFMRDSGLPENHCR